MHNSIITYYLCAPSVPRGPSQTGRLKSTPLAGQCAGCQHDGGCLSHANKRDGVRSSVATVEDACCVLRCLFLTIL